MSHSSGIPLLLQSALVPLVISVSSLIPLLLQSRNTRVRTGEVVLLPGLRSVSVAVVDATLLFRPFVVPVTLTVRVTLVLAAIIPKLQVSKRVAVVKEQ